MIGFRESFPGDPFESANARFNRPHQTMRLSQSIRLEPANSDSTAADDCDGGIRLTNRSDQSELAASEAIRPSISPVEPDLLRNVRRHAMDLLT